MLEGDNGATDNGQVDTSTSVASSDVSQTDQIVNESDTPVYKVKDG